MVNQSSYKWGYVHGSFTPRTALVNLSKDLDVGLVDFRKVGFFGSPGIDLFNFVFELDVSVRDKYETLMIETYWEALGNSGVDLNEYSLRQLWDDYRVLGSSQKIAYTAGMAFSLDQEILDRFDEAIAYHKLTPEEMVTPSYHWF